MSKNRRFSLNETHVTKVVIGSSALLVCICEQSPLISKIMNIEIAINIPDNTSFSFVYIYHIGMRQFQLVEVPHLAL